MTEKDYYAILGINPGAGVAEVKTAYRRLALQYHPDRNKDNPAANTKMMEINEAYAILSDQLKRQEYDRFRQQDSQSAFERYKQTHTTEDIFRGSDIKQVYVDLAKQFGLSDFDKAFRATYGPKYRTITFQDKGRYRRAFVIYDTGKNHNGNTVSSGRGSKTPLETGLNLDSAIRKMSADNGLPVKGKDRKNKIILSQKLARDGGEVTLRLNQHGNIRNLRVTIPAGIKERQRIKLKELGEPGKWGGQPGDLYLEVRFSNSPRRIFRELYKIWKTFF